MSEVSILVDEPTPTLTDLAAVFEQLSPVDQRALADFARFLRDEQNGEQQ